jgi:hypothetical protein
MTNEDADKAEKDRLNKEMARDRWQHKREQVDKSMEYTVQFGHAAIKTPGVVNMAAFAAYLGFISGNAKELHAKMPAVTPMLEACFFWFAVGVVVSALATGGAYFAQYAYTIGDNAYETSWKHPWIEDKRHWARWAAVALHVATVILVLASYFSLIWGAWWFFDLTKAVI